MKILNHEIAKKQNFSKKASITVFIIMLLVLYFYTCFSLLTPNNITVNSLEDIRFTKIWAIKSSIEKQKTLEVSNSSINYLRTNNIQKIRFNLFGTIPLKEVNVNIVERKEVIPVGKAVGLKLYTKGILVVGMSEIEDVNGNRIKPYENLDIKESDMIIRVNDIEVKNTNELTKIVNESEGDAIKITYLRESEEKNISITPAKVSDNEYRLGLWVRDAAAGIGTLTYYDPETKNFVALGHGIIDIDTEGLINISEGELVTTNIVALTKGQRGRPGEIRGTIEGGQKIGIINKNTNIGVYGVISNESNIKSSKLGKTQMALRNEITEGKAQILCQIENGEPKLYDILIEKKYVNNYENNKSMLIKITDEDLIEKTGGIIQGMSGAPIIQNGKLIGAVTNVLVNDPKMGFGIFADMIQSY